MLRVLCWCLVRAIIMIMNVFQIQTIQCEHSTRSSQNNLNVAYSMEYTINYFYKNHQFNESCLLGFWVGGIFVLLRYSAYWSCFTACLADLPKMLYGWIYPFNRFPRSPYILWNERHTHTSSSLCATRTALLVSRMHQNYSNKQQLFGCPPWQTHAHTHITIWAIH